MNGHCPTRPLASPPGHGRSRPSSWWRFETVGRGALTRGAGGRLSAVGAAAGSDRRHGGLCSGRRGGGGGGRVCGGGGGGGRGSGAGGVGRRARARYQPGPGAAPRGGGGGFDGGTAPAILASMPSTPQWIA